jgi:hypothetical protein
MRSRLIIFPAKTLTTSQRASPDATLGWGDGGTCSLFSYMEQLADTTHTSWLLWRAVRSGKPSGCNRMGRGQILSTNR